jgi:hypothetical protein
MTAPDKPNAELALAQLSLSGPHPDSTAAKGHDKSVPPPAPDPEAAAKEAAAKLLKESQKPAPAAKTSLLSSAYNWAASEVSEIIAPKALDVKPGQAVEQRHTSGMSPMNTTGFGLAMSLQAADMAYHYKKTIATISSAYNSLTGMSTEKKAIVIASTVAIGGTALAFKKPQVAEGLEGLAKEEGFFARLWGAGKTEEQVARTTDALGTKAEEDALSKVQSGIKAMRTSPETGPMLPGSYPKPNLLAPGTKPATAKGTEFIVKEVTAGTGVPNQVAPAAPRSGVGSWTSTVFSWLKGGSSEVEGAGAQTTFKAAKVEAPVARVEAPVARVEAPVARVEAPVARVEAPVARVEGGTEAKVAGTTPPKVEPVHVEHGPARGSPAVPIQAAEHPSVVAAPKPVAADVRVVKPIPKEPALPIKPLVEEHPAPRLEEPPRVGGAIVHVPAEQRVITEGTGISGTIRRELPTRPLVSPIGSQAAGLGSDAGRLAGATRTERVLGNIDQDRHVAERAAAVEQSAAKALPEIHSLSEIVAGANPGVPQLHEAVLNIQRMTAEFATTENKTLALKQMSTEVEQMGDLLRSSGGSTERLSPISTEINRLSEVTRQFDRARLAHSFSLVNASANDVEHAIAAIKNPGSEALESIAREIKASTAAGRAPQAEVLAQQIAQLRKAAGTSGADLEAVTRLETSLKQYENASTNYVRVAGNSEADLVADFTRTRTAESGIKAGVEQHLAPLAETKGVAAQTDLPKTTGLAAQTGHLPEGTGIVQQTEHAPQGLGVVQQAEGAPQAINLTKQALAFERGAAEAMPTISKEAAQLAKAAKGNQELVESATKIQKLADGAATAENKSAVLKAVSEELAKAEQAAKGDASLLAPLKQQVTKLEELNKAPGVVTEANSVQTAVRQVESTAGTGEREVRMEGSANANAGRVAANAGQATTPVTSASNALNATRMDAAQLAEQATKLSQVEHAPEQLVDRLETIATQSKAYSAAQTVAERTQIAQSLTTNVDEAATLMRNSGNAELKAAADGLTRQTQLLEKGANVVEHAGAFESGIAQTVPAISQRVETLAAEYPQLKTPAQELKALATDVVRAEDKPAVLRAVSAKLAEIEKAATGNVNLTRELEPLRQQITELEGLSHKSTAAVAEFHEAQTAVQQVEIAANIGQEVAQPLEASANTGRVSTNQGQATTSVTNTANTLSATRVEAAQLADQATRLSQVENAPKQLVDRLETIATQSKAFSAAQTVAERTEIAQSLTTNVEEAATLMRNSGSAELKAAADGLTRQTQLLEKGGNVVEHTVAFESGLAQTVPAISQRVETLAAEYPQLQAPAEKLKALANDAVRAEDKPAVLSAVSAELAEAEKAATGNVSLTRELEPLRQQVTELERLSQKSTTAVAEFNEAQSAAQQLERTAGTGDRVVQMEGSADANAGRVAANAGQATTPVTSASNALSATRVEATQLAEQATKLSQVENAPKQLVDTLETIAAQSKAYKAAETVAERTQIAQSLTTNVEEATTLMRNSGNAELRAAADGLTRQTQFLEKGANVVEHAEAFESGVAQTVPAISQRVETLAAEYPQLKAPAEELKALADDAVRTEDKPAVLRAVSAKLAEVEKAATGNVSLTRELEPLRQQITELEGLNEKSTAAVSEFQETQSVIRQAQGTVGTGGQVTQMEASAGANAERVVANAGQTTTPVTTASNALNATRVNATQLAEQATKLSQVENAPKQLVDTLETIATQSNAYRAAETVVERTQIAQSLTTNVEEAATLMRNSGNAELKAAADGLTRQTQLLEKGANVVEHAEVFESGVVETVPSISKQVEALAEKYPQLKTSAADFRALANDAIKSSDKPAVLRAVSAELAEVQEAAAGNANLTRELAPLRQQITELEGLSQKSSAAVSEFQEAQSAVRQVEGTAGTEANVVRSGEKIVSMAESDASAGRAAINAGQTTTPITNASNALAASTRTAEELGQQASALRTVEKAPTELLNQVVKASEDYSQAAGVERAAIAERLNRNVEAAAQAMRESDNPVLVEKAEQLTSQAQQLQHSASVAERMTQFDQGVSDAIGDTSALRSRMTQLDDTVAGAGRTNVAARTITPRVNESLEAIEANLRNLSTTENRAALLRQTYAEAEKVEPKLSAVGMDAEAQALKRSMAKLEALNSATERAVVAEQSLNRVTESTAAMRNEVREIAGAALPEKAAVAARDIDAQLATGHPTSVLDGEALRTLRTNTEKVADALKGTGAPLDNLRALQLQARMEEVEQGVKTYNQIAKVDNALADVSKQTNNVLTELGAIRGSTTGALNVSPQLAEMESVLGSMRANAAKSNDLENLHRLLAEAKLNQAQNASLTGALERLHAAMVTAAEERTLLMQQQHNIVAGAFDVEAPRMVSALALRDAQDANQVMRSFASPDGHLATQLEIHRGSISDFQRVVFSEQSPRLVAFETSEQRLLRAQREVAQQEAANNNRFSPIPLAHRTDLASDPTNVIPFAGNLRFTPRRQAEIGIGTAAAASVVGFAGPSLTTPAYVGTSISALKDGDRRASYLSVDVQSVRATNDPGGQFGSTAQAPSGSDLVSASGLAVPNVLRESADSLSPLTQNLLLYPAVASVLPSAKGWSFVPGSLIGQYDRLNGAIINLARNQSIFAPVFSSFATADQVPASRSQQFAYASGTAVTPINITDMRERPFTPAYSNPLLTGLKTRSPLSMLHGDPEMGSNITFAGGGPQMSGRGQGNTRAGGPTHEVEEDRTDSTQESQNASGGGAVPSNPTLVAAALPSDPNGPALVQTTTTSQPMPNRQTLADAALMASTAAKQPASEDQENNKAPTVTA